MTDEEWQKFQRWHGAGAPPSSGCGQSGGVLSSLGAGAVGAAKEVAGDFGVASDWAKSQDKDHPTAEWVGRQAADWAIFLASETALRIVVQLMLHCKILR